MRPGSLSSWGISIYLATVVLVSCADDGDGGEAAETTSGEGSSTTSGSTGAATSTTSDGTSSATTDAGSSTGEPGCDYDPNCENVPAGMVCVPAGVFEMGSDVEDIFSPVRQVCMPTYYIDQVEVTAADYGECLADGACGATVDVNETCTFGIAGREDHPINCITVEDAAAYCQWVGKRLPTEAEWEKAARGTDGRTYPWGEEPADCNRANMQGCVNGDEGTLPVGSLSPMGDSPYGLSNMGGNVSELVSDLEGGYDPQETDNPQGPASGVAEVRRGSSLSNGEDLARTFARDVYAEAADDVGMRCALSPS